MANKYLDLDGLSHFHTKLLASQTPLEDGTAATGSSNSLAREDHRHPHDSTKANLASPAFTGNPTAPTQSTSDDSTKLATTAFVHDVIDGLSTGVTGVKGDAEASYRTGQVNLTPANLGIVDFQAAPIYGGRPGVHGLVPAPSAKTGDQIGKKYFLLDDGYWHGGWMDLYFDSSIGDDGEYVLRVRYMQSDGQTQATLWSATLPAVTTTTRGMMRATDKSNLDTLWNSGDYQSDWSQSDSTAADYIKNKPTLPVVPNIWSRITYLPDGSSDRAYVEPHLAATRIDVVADNMYFEFNDFQQDATDPHVELLIEPNIPAATASQEGLLSASDKAKLDAMSGGSVWYGTSSTTAGTAAKVVTCADFTLKTGSIIAVLFSTANTAATPTLNVNSTGAKSIHVGNATPNATTNVLKWSANTLVFFMYDGTQYKYLNSVAAASVVQPRGANTWYGSCSTGATTAAKTSTIDNFVLTKGAVVVLQMTTANTKTDAALTLNVNSTGAKTIYSGNAATSSSNALTWMAGAVLTFVYDGTYWRVLDDGFKAVAGPGLAGYGDSGGGTGFKAKMLSDTALTNAATAATEVANRVYPVAVDSNGNLAVNVPWTDTETTISAGTGISIGSGNVINHSNSVTAGTIGSSSASSGRTIAIPYATYDAQGHITAKGTHTHTIGSLQASDVTSGTFDAARIPNLDASKITSGTIDAARLPSYVDDVIEAYPVSGSTALSAGWLSKTSGGSALTPETGKIYVLMADSGDYNANDTFRWGGSTYVKLSDGAGFSRITETEINALFA